MTTNPGTAERRAEPRAERSARQRWLAVLASAPADELIDRSQAIVAVHRFEDLRAPEQGLAMLCARIGGTGDRFNLGEATLARSVVRHRGQDGRAAVGVGYVLGRQLDRARRIAELDALLQQADHHAEVMRAVVQPLQHALDARHALQRQRTAASRVRFVELQREPGDEA